MRFKLRNAFARVLYLLFGSLYLSRRAFESFLRNPEKRILVLCSGNICRSPYAEVKLKLLLAGAKLGSVEVESRGLNTTPGKPGDARAVEVAKARGVPLDTHLTKSATDEDLRRANLIFIMDLPQHVELKRRLPEVLEKTMYLGAFGMSTSGPLFIRDPFNRDEEVFHCSFEAIDAALASFVTELQAGLR